MLVSDFFPFGHDKPALYNDSLALSF
jgi:hypothetical protein